MADSYNVILYNDNVMRHLTKSHSCNLNKADSINHFHINGTIEHYT